MVAGGGIAGPLAALALARAGLEPVVFEAHDAGSDGVGSFLTLAVNGIRAMDVVGVGVTVQALGMDTPAMRLVSGRGAELGRLPMRARTVRRGDLYGVLRDEAVRRGVPVHYGARLVDARETRTGVVATFADGTTAEGDVLVGADGLRSRVRTLVDPAATQPRHLGLLNVSGYARGVALDAEPGVATFVFGRRCFFGYFLHPDGDVWWFANPPSRREPGREGLLATTSEEWRTRLAALLERDRGPMLDLVAATERVLPAWNTYDLPTVRRWHSDRTVLVGDAVHATSPSSGQGASLAAEDAVVLATCLRDLPEPAQAFAAYESLRRERVERVVRHGRRSGSGKAAGPVGAWVRDLVMPAVLRRMAARGSADWMHDYRVDWDEPVSTVVGVRAGQPR